VSLKRDDFNTPSEILFFEKENGGFEFSLFQNRRWAIFSYLAHSYPAAATTVFFISRWGGGYVTILFLSRHIRPIWPMLLHLLVPRLTTQYAYFLRLGD